MKNSDIKQNFIVALAKRFRQSIVGIVVLLFTTAICQVQAAAPSQTPLFLSIGAKPHIALVMSVDHELFKKAYADYVNLDGENLTMQDTTYRDDFDYYGYFDSDWCYSYSANAATPSASYFTPHSKAVAPAPGPNVTTKTHQCIGAATDTWSGNFLNWVSMTRMDIVRRVLFGGKRSVDDTDKTILERAYLPKDVHAFAKVYGGPTQDIAPYTPYATGTTYSFCNVSTSDNVTSGYPLIRVAIEDWPLWATLESAGNALNGQANGNCSLATTQNDLVPTAVVADFTAKVEACTSTNDVATTNNATVTISGVESPAPRCRKYGNNYKPSGLLQKYGESGAINFSLMSGSYRANHKGGVLRKAAGPLVSSPANNAVDEINVATGQFNNVPGIIRNVSKFRISTYNFGTKKYDDCNAFSIPITDFTALKTINNTGRRCRDWGNPLSEIYLETLRYISGAESPTSEFNVDDSQAEDLYPGIAGLSTDPWRDPWPADQYCAKCSIIVLSTGSNSFDGDDLSSISDLPGMSAALLRQKTDSVGVQEYGNFSVTSKKSFFMGGLNSQSRYCQSVELAGLSDYTGICPELPALEGTYAIAGLAHYARTTDLRPGTSYPNGPDGIHTQKVNTYSVDLAETIPTIPLVVDGRTVRILPACESNKTGTAIDENAADPWSTCSLFDVKIHSLTYSGNNLVAGSMSFYWEDSLWGFDYDLDVEQRLDFCVGPTSQGCNDSTIDEAEIRIRNTIPYAEAGNALRLSYSIYGVNNYRGHWIRNGRTDVAAHRFDGGLAIPWMLRPGGTNYSAAIPNNVGESTFIFTAAQSSVELPKKPLFLAAKYGGFNDLKKNEVTNAALVDDVLDYVKEWDNYKGLQDGVPDNFFSVKNPALLEDSLDNIFTSILRKISSASAVATTSTQLQEGQKVYQALFDSRNWSGELRSVEITASRTLNSTPKATTRTSDINKTSLVANRKIFSYTSDDSGGASNADGTPRETVTFNWNNLRADQRAKLALTGDIPGTDQKRLSWLQGYKTDENAIFGLRMRDFEDEKGALYRNVIGDIVNSTPAYVGATNYRYYGLPASLGGGAYSNFVNWKKGGTLSGYPATSTPRIFVGSNGGMLHAFHADTLQELFAYVPNRTFHKLAKLTERDYGTNANQHQYLVDGPIVSGDAFISTPNDPVKKWRSIIVGTFGAGGKGIYALDVTKERAPEVLFEYSHADMGYILGKPVIVPTAEGRWAVIVGNGIDTSPTKSALFVVDLESPYSRTRILDVDNNYSGTGLSAPSVLVDAAGVATTVYAGDLSGNMMRFSIADASFNNWTSYRVFAAVSKHGYPQPIIAAPTIGYNNTLNKNMIYFGTGRYHDEVDKDIGVVAHSIYAIPDQGPTGTAATRADLLMKTMTTDYASSLKSRVVSTDNPDWTNEVGWYLDLDHDINLKRDERVTIKPVLIQDRLFVTTLLPSNASCLPGGSSWFMEITAVGDGYKTKLPPVAIYSEALILGDPGIGILGPVIKGSTGSTGSASSASSAANDDECSRLDTASITSNTSGQLTLNSFELKSCMLGRQSWKQLK